MSWILVGAAIDLGTAFFPDLEGYPAMWPVAGLLALLSVPALLRAVAVAPGNPDLPGEGGAAHEGGARP